MSGKKGGAKPVGKTPIRTTTKPKLK